MMFFPHKALLLDLVAIHLSCCEQAIPRDLKGFLFPGYLELVRRHNGGWLKCIFIAERGRWNSSIAVLKTSRLNNFDGQFVSHDGKEAVLLFESWD